MKRTRLTNLIIALVLILTSGLLTGRAAAQDDAPPQDLQAPAAGQLVLNNTWLLERADAPVNLNAGSPRMLAVDDGGNLNVAYGGDFLYYAYKSTGSSVWAKEVVDDGGGRGGVGAYASIAVDSFRMPHIAYFDSITGGLKYAVQSCNEEVCYWSTGYVDPSNLYAEPMLFPTHPSIAVDGAGGVHIAYYDKTSTDLRYAYKAYGAVSWTLTAAHADPIANIGVSPSLALNGSTPCISYLDRTDINNAKVLFTCAPFTTHEQIDYNDAYSTALAIGGGYFQVVFQNEYRNAARPECVNNHNVVYASKPLGGGSWNLEEMPLSEGCTDLDYPFRGFGLSLALESGSLPRFVFFDSTGDTGRYYKKTAVIGGSWQETTTYPAGISLSTYSSIGMDGSAAHIVSQVNNGSIYHKWWDGAAYQQEVVDAGTTSTGTESSLASKNGNPSVAYLQGSNLYFRVRSGGAWSNRELVENYVYRSMALAQGTQPQPRLIYFADGIGMFEQITFAQRLCPTAVCTWPFKNSLVEGAWHTYQMNIALDSTGKVYTVYKNPVTDQVVLRSGTFNTWDAEVIIASGVTSIYEYAEVAVDSQDKIHVIFTNDAGSLMHRTNKIGFWALPQTISSGLGTPVYIPNDIAIYMDVPRVVFYNKMTGWLMYAPYFQNSWSPEAVIHLGTGYADGFSIAMGPTGIPYIAFFDPVDKDLVLASRSISTGQWSFQDIDTAGDVGQQPSLAVDANGLKRISYFDATNGDLKVAMEQARVLLPAVLR